MFETRKKYQMYQLFYSYIQPLIQSFAKYQLDTYYVLQIKQRIRQIPYTHGAHILAEMNK